MKVFFIIFLIIITSSCYKYEDWYEKRDKDYAPSVDFDNLMDLHANGVDTLLINIYFPTQADRELVRANLKIEEGTFIESGEKQLSLSQYTVDKNPSNKQSLKITARLKTSTKIGSHQLEIEVPEVFKTEYSINFFESLPSNIYVSAEKFAIEANYIDEIKFSAKVKASRGLVHQGTKVYFTAADTILSNNILHFRELTTTNESGIATVQFTPGDLDGFRGTIPVVAYVYDENETRIADTTYIRIVDPD